MNICVDVGNTMVKIGVIEDDVLIKTLSFKTEINRSEDEIESVILSLLRKSNIKVKENTSIILSSVVPTLNVPLKNVLKKIFGSRLFVLGVGLKTGVALKVDNPSEVGSDLIADIAGLKAKYGAPAIVADLGTATKILLLDKDGFFSACSIAPGLIISSKCLSSQGELLPNVSLEAPKSVLGRNTVEAMNSGILYGHLELVEGLVRRFEEELGYKCHKVLTGGNANYIKDIISKDFILDLDLAIEGLNIILEKNKGI